MRYLIMIASLALAANALADEKPRSVARELDKSSPQLMSADAPSGTTDAAVAREEQDKSKQDQPKSRAQDYNSSRSNTTALREDKQGDLDRDGNPDVSVCRDGVDDDCDDAEERAAPANHNTTRSNRLAPVDGGDDPVVRKKTGKR